MYFSRIGRSKLASQRIESCYFDAAYLQHSVARERSRIKTSDYYDNPSRGSVNVNYDGSIAVATMQIFGKVITHEIGDSQADSLMRRVIVEAVPFLEDMASHGEQTFLTYDYTIPGNEYPKLYAHLRNNAFTMVPNVFQKIIDLVGLNMAPKQSVPGINPWRSILQTPTIDAPTRFNMDEYSASGNPNGDVANVHESFVLLSPLNSKFRRCRLKYVCKYTVILRAFTIEYQQLSRRFG